MLKIIQAKLINMHSNNILIYNLKLKKLVNRLKKLLAIIMIFNHCNISLNIYFYQFKKQQL